MLDIPVIRSIDTQQFTGFDLTFRGRPVAGENRRILIQFVRIRRGVRVVIRTVAVEAEDSRAALAWTRGLLGTRRWPMNTDAVRVMDDGGRTLLDWSMPSAGRQPVAPSPRVDREEMQLALTPAALYGWRKARKSQRCRIGESYIAALTGIPGTLGESRNPVTRLSSINRTARPEVGCHTLSSGNSSIMARKDRSITPYCV